MEVRVETIDDMMKVYQEGESWYFKRKRI